MQRLARTLGALILVFAAAGPASAAEAFVPFAVHSNDRGVVRSTELLVTNTQPSLRQSVTFVWRSSAGGRDRRRTVELEAGESRVIDRLVPNGRLGRISFDAPFGVAVSARLRIERPGAQPALAHQPVVESATAARPRTRLLLQGLESLNGERSSSLAVLNLGAREATCDVTLRGTDDSGLATSLQISVRSRDQVLLDDLSSLFSGEAPAESIASVSCDREFWAVGAVEDVASGAMRVVDSAFDAVASTTSNHSLSGNGTPSTFFSLPGLFLTSNSGNVNWRYEMRFSESKTFRKVVLDYDVYIAGWDSSGQTYHCLFWLNNEHGWSNGMMGYLNLVAPRASNRTKLEAHFPTYINDQKYVAPEPGGTYHVHYEIDMVNGVIWYQITDGGATNIVDSWATSATSYSTAYMFIEFGTQLPGEGGPEARTYGWQFSNFVAEYVP